MTERGDRVTFLVVDDDDVAVMGMQRAIRKLELSNPVEIARDGEAALAKLRCADGGVSRPYIVTLDLNMLTARGVRLVGRFMGVFRFGESWIDRNESTGLRRTGTGLAGSR